MGLLDIFRRTPHPSDPELSRNVQFDRGGRTYTYQRTEPAFREMLADRAAPGREAPYRVEALVRGRWVEVRVEVGG